MSHGCGMAELAKFVQRGATMITPKILKGVHKRLPFLKLKFTEFDDPEFPHLSDQLEFMADVVEDFVEGVEEDLPYATVIDVTFALIYADRQAELMPEPTPELGFADDSAVVRFVLQLHEKVLAAYADRHKMKWEEVSVRP
jgi:uncharacterized membrane protein YkvA (DUF1232 family)